MTSKPERFGIISGGQIVDKRPRWETHGPFYAWGAWAWSRQAMTYLCEMLRETHDHTKGLNLLIKRYPPAAFPLDYYYDFAAFDDYRTFLEIHR